MRRHTALLGLKGDEVLNGAVRAGPGRTEHGQPLIAQLKPPRPGMVKHADPAGARPDVVPVPQDAESLAVRRQLLGQVCQQRIVTGHHGCRPHRLHQGLGLRIPVQVNLLGGRVKEEGPQQVGSRSMSR